MHRPTNEFVSDGGSLDDVVICEDEAVDEGHDVRLVVVVVGASKLVHQQTEPVPLLLAHLSKQVSTSAVGEGRNGRLATLM